MRTTLSIDDDVAKLVEDEVRRSGDTFKGTVNRLLRQGLMTSKNPGPRKRFVVMPFPLGIGNCDKISDLIEELEGPYHR